MLESDEFTRAMWHFDECEGLTTSDNSGNAYHLTLSDEAGWIVESD